MKDRVVPHNGLTGRPRPIKATASKAAIISMIAIAVLGFLAYANTINGKFVWDDEFLVEKNFHIRSLSSLGDIFAKDIGAGSQDREGYLSYRPLQMLSYLLNYAVCGLDVRLYHITNIILHIMVAICVYWLTRALFKDSATAFAAGAIFAVHPININAVAYISGRADSLAAVFMLLCIIAYIRMGDSTGGVLYAGMIASYALALLSRENSLVVPALLLVYHYSFRKKPKPFNLISVTAVAVLYCVLRLTFLAIDRLHQAVGTTALERLPGFFAAFLSYLRLLIYPYPLHMEYGSRAFAVSDPRVIAGLAAVAILAYLVIKFSKKGPLVPFCILWFIVALLPSSNIYPLDAYMAEHWLYIPSIGAFILAGALFGGLYSKEAFRAVSIVLLAAALSAYSYLTIKQNVNWTSPVRLYSWTVRFAPDSYKSYNNLGIILKDRGKLKEAERYFEKALAIKPDYDDALGNLGGIYLLQNRTQDAIDMLKRVIESNPKQDSAYANLGKCYNDLGMYKEAGEYCQKALDMNPFNVGAYINLGMSYSGAGRNDRAIELYKKALALEPDNVKALIDIGKSYSEMRDYKTAIEYLQKAISHGPDDGLAHNNLAVAYYFDSQYSRAIEHTDAALALGFRVNETFLRLINEKRSR